jgi:DNA helicase-2/ATP-dependent DNA helicase PcrA
MRSLYLTYARRRALFGAASYGLRSRFLNEIPDELLHVPADRRLRPGAPGAASNGTAGLARTSWSDAARGSGTGGARGELPRFRLGEDIVHAAFGDGVVTGVEPGGVIVVRFAGDGSERKLMADHAPLSRR